MTRFAWLALAVGILTLTIVDGGYLVVLSSYSTSKIHSNNEAEHNQNRLNGPVLSVVIETFDATERLIERHEKLLIVLATIAIAWFTRTLWAATVELSRMAKQQAIDTRESLAISERNATTAENNIDLARKEFISTHRPRITIRRVSVATVNGIGVPDALKAEFIVANVGDTKATIVEMSTRLWLPQFAHNLPAIPPYEASTYPGLLLESGASSPLTHIDSAEMLARFESRTESAAFATTDGGVDNGPAFIFIGYIVYEDELKRARRTAFCRIYNFATERFDPISHPDYEYQD